MTNIIIGILLTALIGLIGWVGKEAISILKNLLTSVNEIKISITKHEERIKHLEKNN
jgi:hypothetical protein